MDGAKIKAAIRQTSAELAARTLQGRGPLWRTTEPEHIPREAVASSASCGQPLEHVTLKPGHVVLDVGCGAGVDVFSASRRVGQLGHVIGVDMTLEMILKARQLAEKYDYKNVDFRLGEAERLPVETKTVDVVISNCVLNMVPDKLQALEEMHRVLRRRGTLSMTDVIATHTQPRQRNTDPLDWAASAVGAITVIAYVRLLRKAGFQRIHAFDEESVRNKLQIQSSVQVNAMAFLASKP